MSEAGGTTTQSGIHYQNSIAALFLGRLLDPHQRTASERVIQVRVEAPEHVDDIVVRHADCSRSFIQAKEALSLTSKEWGKLWIHFASQAQECATEQFRLILAIGTISGDIGNLRELCDRAKGKQSHEEWINSLSLALETVAKKIIDVLPEKTANAAFKLVKFIEVWIWPLNIIERDMVPLWIPPSSSSQNTLFDLLRGKVGGKARIRGLFHMAQLLDELSTENNVNIQNVQSWGMDAYLQAVRTELGILSVPGTNLRGPIEDIFLWMPLHDRVNDNAHLDFEDEDPRWRWEQPNEIIDLRDFPRGKIVRAVVDAGAGFGKTTLLHAIACKLCAGVHVPALISLDSLASSNMTILGYLNDKVNADYDVSIDWERLCEGGRAVVLLDGLDELSVTDRTSVLNTINKFAARFQKSTFLLTVRDSTALTVPLGVPVLALNRLDDFAIRQFAEAYAHYGGCLSPDTLSSHIQRHPDLSHLLRIPLFLALVLASVGPEDNLPRSRSELLEHYLSLLLSPEKYKAMAVPLPSLSDLREAAELLAWRGLEADGIGLAEIEARRLLKGQGLREQPDVYIERLVQVGVLRRAAARLRFAYPILQEYLAACWMVANAPNEIGPRFGSISRRPWAQTLQFALEMHPDSDTIINNQLKAPDDVFYTTLRLIARCIVNGAKVNPEIKRLVGDRLAEVWPSESYPIQNSIGYLLADGFLDPLPQKAIEHISTWALHCGGAEIVTSKSSPTLTREILINFIAKDLDFRPYLHGWQAAVDDIANEALDLYLERVREKRTTEKELDSLSSLIAVLPPTGLRPNRWHEIATDSTLPPLIRLGSYKLGPRPVPSSAWVVINNVINLSESDESHHLYAYSAYNLYWNMIDAEDKFIQILNDPETPEKMIRAILGGLLRSDMDSNTKQAILRRAISKSNPARNTLFLILLCLAIWGDEEAESDTVPMLADQDFDKVTAWLLQSNKFSETTVRKGAIILSERTFDTKQLLLLINSADFGLRFKTDASIYDGAAASEPYIHPSRAEMLSRLLTNLKDDDESIEALKVRLQTGDISARERLITEIRMFIAGFKGFMPYEDDNNICNTLYLLGQQSLSLPFDLLFQIIDKSSSFSNAGHYAVDLIVRSGDDKVIQPLLDRYNSRGQDFVCESIFAGLETLGGRYGKRFVREGSKIIIE